MSKRLKISWRTENSDSKLKRFEIYLKDNGIRSSTIEEYTYRIKKYLEYCGDKKPSPETAQQFRETLLERNLARSTINNYCFGIRHYHAMQGQDIKFKTLKKSNIIPYYFTADEVNRIFDQINNIKHLAIFKTGFYACLRASEICNLDIEDIDLDRLTLKVRNGKGGKSAMCYLQEDAVDTLREYLAVRPDFEMAGRNPLFYTDFGNRFDRYDISGLVDWYKKKAGITKPGNSHVLFRHSPASIMILNGMDILSIQSVMRHSQILTTMRYLHLADDAKRQKYDKFLRL